jgi:hypothetical protein
VLTFDTVETGGAGITLGSPASRLVVATAGVYVMNYSIQFTKSGGNASFVTIWLRIDGVNVPRSASKIVISGNNGETFPFCEYLLPLTAGQYIEFVFASSDATVTANAFTATSTVPAVPSIIANVYRVG